MKRILLSALLAAAAIGANAESYVVFSGDALKDGEEQIPLQADYINWDGTHTLNVIDDPTSPDGKAWEFTYGTQAWMGGGFIMDASFDQTKLIDPQMCLKFDAKTTAPASWRVKFVNGGVQEIEIPFELAADGNWHEVSLCLNEVVPAYYNSLPGASVYAIAIAGQNGAQGQVLDITNVRYELGELQYAFGNVYYGTHEQTCTPIDTQVTYDVSAQFSFTANADGTLVLSLTLEGADGFNPGHQFHVVKAAKGEIPAKDQWVYLTQDGDNWIGTATELTFELGEAVPSVELYCPFAGGVFQKNVITYIFGAANEAPVSTPSLKLSAQATDITAESAAIAWTLKPSAHFADTPVTVLLDGTAITDNPYALTGLTEKTEYTHTLQAVATLDGVEYKSDEVVVTFTTLRSGATATVWHAIVDGTINNAYLPGEDPATARRGIPASALTTVTYNTDQTITVDAEFQGQLPVGAVPKITISSNDYKFEYKDMTRVEGNKYTITTDVTYPMDHNIGWLYFFIAYDGGSSTINVNGYTTGLENDPVAYGAPTSIDLTVANPFLKAGDSTRVTAIVKDAAGHYLLAEPVTITVDGNFDITGNVITATGKGEGTVTATAGALSATATISCIVSADAKVLAPAAVVADHDNWAAAFDGNEATEVIWDVNATGAEHYIVADLGNLHDIEAVCLVWEGASATEYKVTLSGEPVITTPAPSAAPARVAAANTVMIVTDGEGGAGLTVRKNLVPGNPVAARYITLETSKAFEPAWGMKLKEMQVLGNPDISGVADVAVDAATAVNVYNLQGVLVRAGVDAEAATEGLPAGLYIVGGRKVIVN